MSEKSIQFSSHKRRNALAHVTEKPREVQLPAWLHPGTQTHSQAPPTSAVLLSRPLDCSSC